MSSHNLTPAEEMYLIAISLLDNSDPTEPVSISTLAENLNLKSVSANQMINKLAKEGWVTYIPYQGAQLTNKGVEQAHRILWIRRLWETFLIQELGISQENTEELACDLEHHTSNEMAEALDEFLGYPEFRFRGNLIIRGQGDRNRVVETFLLKDMQINSKAVVVEIKSDLVTAKFLENEGIIPGVDVRIIVIGNGKDYLVEYAGKKILLSEEIASEIILRKENAMDETLAVEN